MENRTPDEILTRLCEVEHELSQLHESNKHGSFDMDGNKRRNLGEEHVFLSRQLEASDNCGGLVQTLMIKYASGELPVKLVSLEYFKSEITRLIQAGVLGLEDEARAVHQAQLALGLIPDDTARGEYLGTDPHGFSYYWPDWQGFYVYRYSPAGEPRGWICTIDIWERTMHNLLQMKGK